MVISMNSCLLVFFLIPKSISILLTPPPSLTTTPPSPRTTSSSPTTTPPSPSSNPGKNRPIYDDCVAAHYKPCNRDSIDGIYCIKSRTSVGYEDTVCRRGSDTFPDCTGIGWTYIGLVNGDRNTSETGYDSEHWTIKGDNQTVFNSQFWSANVTEVCLSSTGFKIQFPVLAPSLRSLFFENTTLEIPLQQWVDGLKIDASHLNLTDACFVSGFNVGNPNHVRARLGVVSVLDGPGCSLNLAIGIGIKVTGKEFGSLHGIWEDKDTNAVSYQQVDIYVRSRPNPTAPAPTVSSMAETMGPIF